MALIQFDYGVGEPGVDHLHRAVIVDPKKDAGAEQNLHLAGLRVQRLSRRQYRGAHGAGTERFRADGSLPLDIIDGTRLRGTRILSLRPATRRKRCREQKSAPD